MGEIVQRAWGTYEVLAEGPRYKVKRLIMEPGKSFSLQYHHHRAEVWTVVRGTAEVVYGENIKREATEGAIFCIVIGDKHKLSNPGKIPVEVIEVQLGAYLEEDDIVRLDGDPNVSGGEASKEN